MPRRPPQGCRIEIGRMGRDESIGSGESGGGGGSNGDGMRGKFSVERRAVGGISRRGQA